MTKEQDNIIKDLLNQIPGVRAGATPDDLLNVDYQVFDCTKVKWRYHIYFYCNNWDSLAKIGRCFERNYSNLWKGWNNTWIWSDTKSEGAGSSMYFAIRGKPSADFDRLVSYIKYYCLDVPYEKAFKK